MSLLETGLGSQQQCYPAWTQMTQSEQAACASWGLPRWYQPPATCQVLAPRKLEFDALCMLHRLPLSCRVKMYPTYKQYGAQCS